MHALNAHRGTELQLHLFSTFALDELSVQSYASADFSSDRLFGVSIEQGDWTRLRTGQDILDRWQVPLDRWQVPFPCRESIGIFSVRQPVALWYTDYAISAVLYKRFLKAHDTNVIQ